MGVRPSFEAGGKKLTGMEERLEKLSLVVLGRGTTPRLVQVLQGAELGVVVEDPPQLSCQWLPVAAWGCLGSTFWSSRLAPAEDTWRGQ